MTEDTMTAATEALLSLTSGVLLTNSFSDVHEVAEFISGHPLWTHEFADKAVWSRLRDLVLQQHPDMDIDLSHVNKENVAVERDRLLFLFGSERLLRRGSDLRQRGPIESLIDIMEGSDA